MKKINILVFTDNTNKDVYLNAKSINNIINGFYMITEDFTISGTSLLEVLALVNESEQTTLTATSAGVMTKVTAISTTSYFDYQLMDETIDNFNKPIMSAILTLRKQVDALSRLGKSITRDTIDPRV